MNIIEFSKQYYDATMANIQSHLGKNETDTFREPFKQMVISRRNRKYYLIFSYLLMVVFLSFGIVIAVTGNHHYLWIPVVQIICAETFLCVGVNYSLLLVLFNFILFKNDNNAYKKMLNNLFLDSGFFNNFYDKKSIKSIYKMDRKSLLHASYTIIGKSDSVVLIITRSRILLQYYKDKKVFKKLQSIDSIIKVIQDYCGDILNTNKEYQWKFKGLALKNKFVLIHGYKMSIKKCVHFKRYKGVSCKEYPMISQAEMCRCIHRLYLFDFLMAETKDGYIYFLKEVNE